MTDHEFKAPTRPTCYGEGELDASATRLAEIWARAQAATDGPWRMRHGATTEYAIHVEFGEVLVVPDGWGWADNDWRKINADAEFIAHARSDVPWLMAEVDRLTGERDRALGLTARLEEQLARVEALAEEWRYKGEFGWGAWQEGYGPDPQDQVLDDAATRLRAALTGDGA